MKLRRISVSGFRSLNIVEIDFANLTVLIGENDAGKSSLLDIIDIFLNNRSPDNDDYYCDIEGQRADKIVVEMDFELDEKDTGARVYAIENTLQVKKTYHFGDTGFEFCHMGEVCEDGALNVDFQSMNASDQKALIQRYEPNIEASEISNNEKRIEWFGKYKQQAPKKCEWIIDKNTWGKLLPRFERYSAMDYKTPSSLVTKTLRQVFEQTIFETIEVAGQQERSLIHPLQEVERIAQTQLTTKINELEEHIKRYNRRIRDFGYQPQFDFTSSLKEGEFSVDTGRGLHPLSKIGDGTKRRMFLAVMDWDREVTLTQANEESDLPTIIRGYDEPDTNLHYEAQRLMYQTISDIVHGENSRVQALLCTHSMAMIDRAPAQSIRKLGLDHDGCTQVEKLNTQDDPDIENFLLNLARELGITNSVIFYERCFVLIEGETEENALPIFYKKKYKRSLIEDGIRVINVRGNGAIKEFLQLLSNNRQQYTLVFIDKDSETNPAVKLHPKVLKDAHFAEEFFKDHILYIGRVEFEDIFSDELIVSCLQKCWPKTNSEWRTEDIVNIRHEGKFSDRLKKVIYDSEIQDNCIHWSKPAFGKAIAEICTVEDIPEEIISFFERAREISDNDL